MTPVRILASLAMSAILLGMGGCNDPGASQPTTPPGGSTAPTGITVEGKGKMGTAKSKKPDLGDSIPTKPR